MSRSLLRPTRPLSGNWLERWRTVRRPHPLVFRCGVRVVAGEVPGLGSRWRFRDSAIDRLPVPGRTTVQWGTKHTLRVEDPTLLERARARPGHVVLTAVDATTGATVELSVPAGEAISFGVEL